MEEGDDDLLSRISRNVEANLENFTQQHSAWDSASSQLNAKSSIRLETDGRHDSTSNGAGDRSTLGLKPSTGAMNSMDIQHWPSPVSGISNNFHSVRESSDLKPSQNTRLKGDESMMIRKIPTNTYVEESTFIRSDSLKSNSMLRLADILSQNILLHPFIALRRTCQVNRKCSPFICIQPFSLIPFMYHQQRKQGIAALYKGLSSELLVKGITLGTETALANYADWPREVSHKRYLEDSFKIMILRGLSVALTTPFLCTSVIETVQSVIVMKDRPSFVDCLKDGFLRLLHLRSTPSNRMLPIWLVVLPTVFYYVTHTALWHVSKNCVEFFKKNFLSKSFRRTSAKFYREPMSNKNHTSKLTNNNSTWHQDTTTAYDSTDATIEVDNFEVDNNQISSSIIASLIADIALLPVETVLNSLYIQGTRTIIDNVDETTVVLPVLTNYDGFADCYQSILKFEGTMGLYKGLGAIILQYSVHFLIFRSLYYLLREFQSSATRDRNAHSTAPLTKPQQKPIRQPIGGLNNEYLHFNNRHSTPNNLATDFNRFNGDDLYRIDDTPKRFSRI